MKRKLVKKVVNVLYKPHEKQKIFHDSQAKFRAIITGVGFGKSAAGVNELIKDCIQHPGTLNLLAGPTFPMVKNTTLREFFKFCPKEIIKKHNRSEHIVTLTNNAQVIYLSGDNERDIDRIRGLTLGSAYGDEISISPEYFWDVVLSRLRDPRGSLRAWVTTTPKGFNWIRRLFFQKLDKKGQPLKNAGDYALFGGSTLDNPYTPEEYKKSLMDTYVGAFRKQEIYGEFVGYEGLVYPSFSRNTHILQSTTKKFKEVIAGVDFGFTNPTAIAVIGLDEDDRAYVIAEFYEKKIMVDESGLIRILKHFRKKYNISMFYPDPSAAAYIEMMEKAGLPVEAADNEVIPGIAELTSRMEVKEDGQARFYVLQKCIHTIMEFENYRYPEGKEDKPVQENPIKMFDHLMDAIRYALFTKKSQAPADFEFLEI